ncbi:MAG TPA: prepilin-type N-terminal cleavage/methylation domain-containing protein [Pyrinomonadaceae bacterium]|nr:prepilin-type N-terminal cleavage/methylation domain-containing protein [Pyrinomonadaceae bacterium]
MSRGFSVVELLVVLVVIGVLSAASTFYILGHRRLFRPDEQAMRIVDALQEARQRSLTQRETMRVEIDLTDRMVRIIDENSPTTVDDDVLVRASVLYPSAEVRTGTRPPDILTNPEESMPVPIADFRPSIYPPSATHTVCTLRFLRNGAVVDQGADALGSNATTIGATLYLWTPKSQSENETEIARAITVIGATGAIRSWEYDRALESTNKWKDSRRSGTYGGQGGN